MLAMDKCQAKLAFVLLSVLWCMTGMVRCQRLSDLYNTIAKAHKTAAVELNDAGHRLIMHRVEMPRQHKPCPEHFKCWSGEIDGEAYESRQLFLDGTYQMSDMIISVEQEHAYVWVGCEDNMVELPLSFIHASNYGVFKSNITLLKNCEGNLTVSVRKVQKSLMTRYHIRPITIHLILDLSLPSNAPQSRKFMNSFYQKLTHGINESLPLLNANGSATEDSITANHSLEPNLIPAPPAPRALRQRRYTRSTDGPACGIKSANIDLSALQKYITLTTGYEAYVMPQSGTKFYYCAGYCKLVQLFPDDAISSPMRNQLVHDKYWTTANVLTTQHLISEGPEASCVGYGYSFSEIIYMVGDQVHLQYLHFPSQCACV